MSHQFQIEIEEDSQQDSPKSDKNGKRDIVVYEDDDWMVKLRGQCCAGCLPHQSDVEDTGVPVPTSLAHTPWDEVEMSKHDLLSPKCEHVSAAPPLDELRIRSSKPSPKYPHRQKSEAEVSPDAQTKLKFEVDEFSNEESEEESDHSHQWNQIDEAPVFRNYANTEKVVGGNVMMKQTADGGRLLFVKNDNGCEVRILENVRGERILVSTRCSGEAHELPKTALRETTESGVSAWLTSSESATTKRSRAPVLSLMSGGTDQDNEATPTLSSSRRKPLVFDSIVANSESGMASRGSSAEIPVSTREQAKEQQQVSIASSEMKRFQGTPKSKNAERVQSVQKSEKRADAKPSIRVAVNLRVAVRPMEQRSEKE